MISRKGSIIDEMFDYPISEEVKSVANSVYQDLDIPAAKKTNRRKAICFCIYQAYIDIENPVDMPIIAKIVGLSVVKADRSINKFWPKLKGIHKSVYISVESLIECYCRHEFIDINDESMKEIKSLYRMYEEGAYDPGSLKDRLIVAALIWNFIDRNAKTYVTGEEEFASIFGYRPNTLRNACKTVSEACERKLEKLFLSSKLPRRIK